VDLIDVRRRGTEIVQVFPTREALSEYTKRTASYFPCNSPKAGNLLRKLLSKPRLEVPNPLRAMQDTPAEGKAKAKDNRHQTSRKSKKYTKVEPSVGDRTVIAMAKAKDFRRPTLQGSKGKIISETITETEGPIKAKAKAIDDRRPTTRKSKKNMMAEMIKESNTYPSSTW